MSRRPGRNTLGDWIGAHTRALAAIRGVPRLIALRAAVEATGSVSATPLARCVWEGMSAQKIRGNHSIRKRNPHQRATIKHQWGVGEPPRFSGSAIRFANSPWTGRVSHPDARRSWRKVKGLTDQRAAKGDRWQDAKVQILANMC
jgi:hypothetical protein